MDPRGACRKSSDRLVLGRLAALVGGFTQFALGGPDVLFDRAGDLFARIAGHLAEGFLDRALDFLGRPVDAVLVHRWSPGYRGSSPYQGKRVHRPIVARYIPPRGRARLLSI